MRRIPFGGRARRGRWTTWSGDPGPARAAEGRSRDRHARRTSRPPSTTAGHAFRVPARRTRPTLGIPARRAGPLRQHAAPPADQLQGAPLRASSSTRAGGSSPGAERRSAAYGKFLADGLTRTLVAAKAREMSARTGGTILLQLLFDLARPGGQVDRVLNGPTNDVWIDPWLEHLQLARRRLPPRAPGAGASQLRGTGGSAASTSSPAGSRCEDSADYYVAALPVEVMRAAGHGRDEAAGAAAGGPPPPADPLDERDHVLPRPRRRRWSTATPSTSTPRGR